MAVDPATECLPPDTDVAGLWWVQYRKDNPVAWLWLATLRVWALPGRQGSRSASFSPAAAHAAGWRIYGMATVPGDAA